MHELVNLRERVTEAQGFRGGVDDAGVRLVGHEGSEVGDVEAGLKT
ncbi:hypothetical protein OIE74_27920 [Streptomyces sp. NBC_01716]|nr:hypothetical protein [Streptomyces sp. NBC_01716]